MFLAGLLFIIFGLVDMLKSGTITHGYEKLIIGSILFVPGAYHTLLAVQALRGVSGWDYSNLTAFEDENHSHNVSHNGSNF